MTSFAQEPDRPLSADGVLTRAYLDGDESAFAELYRRYYGDVVRIVRANVRDYALAEDIAQEAFSRALRYLPTYDPTQPFWPWIRKIARGVTCSEMTRRGAEVPVDGVPREPAAPDIAETVALQAAVMESLRLLPKRQRRALVMRYIEDRNANDIATLLGLSRNALEQLLLRGRTSFARDYRARNVAMVPVFGPLVARLRRLGTGLGARLQHATGTGFSVAGDVALGAALTVGGIGMTLGVITDSTPPRPSASPGTEPVDSNDPPGTFLRPPRVGPAGSVATIALPDSGRTATRESARVAHPGEGAGPRHEPPGTAATEPPAPPAAAPTAPPGGGLPPVPIDPPPPATPSPSPRHAEAIKDVNPPDVPTPSASEPPSNDPSEDPLPEPTVWVDENGAGAAVEDDGSNTSGEMTAKSNPRQEGDVAKGAGNVDTGSESDVRVEVTVSNSSNDGAACYLLKVLCT